MSFPQIAPSSSQKLPAFTPSYQSQNDVTNKKLPENQSAQYAPTPLANISITKPPPEKVRCNIPSYGNKFPKQKENMGVFTHYLNANGFINNMLDQAKVSKSVYNPGGSVEAQAVKGGHDDEAIVQLWQQRLNKMEHSNQFNGKQFNGKQLSVYYTLVEEGQTPRLKLCPNDFVTVTIARSRSPEKPTDLPLRDHYNCGVLIAYLTTDNKILYSIRQGKNAFPGGFILGDKSQRTDEAVNKVLDPIRKNKNTFTELVKETAVKEANEEIIASDINPDDVEIIGWAGEQFTYPSKTRDNFRKEVFCIKSIGTLIKCQTSSEDLQKKRNENMPEDADELPELLFLTLDEIIENTKKGEPGDIDDKGGTPDLGASEKDSSNNANSAGKSFVLEHANFYQMLGEHFVMYSHH